VKSADDAKWMMNSEEFHLLRDVFERASGFVLQENLKFVAERRLAIRAQLLGLNSFLAYQRYLRFDANGPAEIDEAVDVLVPHETYFFREPVQLNCFVDEVVPILAKLRATQRKLSCWSAGCSTGEEAYTLAMLMWQCANLKDFSIDIFATDLSSKSLAHARKAEYGNAALRATTPAQIEQFFDAIDESPQHKRYRVKEPFRKPVRLGKLNLIDESAFALLPRFDVIVCRNVMIYFDLETRKKLLDLFFDRLKPGGFLLLGHSENLLSLSTRFSAIQLQNDLVYRRAE
jgi:chemotaxis protein methyltransferase CheR